MGSRRSENALAPIPGFRAVIPAGGAGTRLWPLSRQRSPKFLHDATGSGRTLIQATWDRLLPLAGPGGIVVVTGGVHRPAVRAQLPDLDGKNALAEPSPRDSMAAIGLAAAVLAHREGDVVIGSFAADHVIHGQHEFRTAIEHAVEAARADYVVTIGIAAKSASTGFGYIHVGHSLELAGAPDARHVIEFTEKPDAPTAASYVATGEYRWNAGMFVTRCEVLLGHLEHLHPALHDGLRTIALAWDTPRRSEVLAQVWPGLERISIDHAVAEPLAAAGGVAVVPGDFGWDDVGDWSSLGDLVTPDANGARVIGNAEDVLVIDAPGVTVAAAGGRKVCLLGANDLVVVDTPDALLVTTRARAQQVKDVVAELRASGREDLL